MKIQELNKVIGFYFVMFIGVLISVAIGNEILNTSEKGGGFLLLIGIWMLITVPIFILIRSKISITIYCFFNSVMVGFTIIALYRCEYYRFNQRFYDYFKYYIGILFIHYLVISFIRNKRVANLILIGSDLIGLVIGFNKLINEQVVLGSSIITIFFLILSMNLSFYYYSHSKREFETWKVFKLASMLTFGFILFLAITAISEGDTLDSIADSIKENKQKMKK